MQYKSFSKILFVVLALFVILNLAIWEMATKDILTRDNKDVITGDMSRMGYLPHLNHPRYNSIDLQKKHLNHTQLDSKIDLITIGDSFSQGMAGGHNRFYQDYLATKSDLSILNVQQIPFSRNYLETIMMLLNSGELQKYNVKYILVESTQRKVVGRFSIPIDFTSKLNENQRLKNSFFKISNKAFGLPKVQFINNGNFKYLGYRFLYNFSPNAMISKVFKVKLEKPFFSVASGDDLLFYKSDLDSVKKNTKKNIEVVNEQLNLVAKALNKEGIKLIFMPAVAKYDLYRDFIVQKDNFAQDHFFDYFREMKKEYLFVDTKSLLLSELKKGTKDIFYVDDTHWSFKASEVISNNIIKQIEEK